MVLTFKGRKMQLTTDKHKRKEQPITRGVMDYFPNALAEVARVSFVGNQQHNPGEEMHWSRGKSSDHADCIARHLIERGTLDDDGLRHTAKVAWRALALLQLELEASQKAVECGPHPLLDLGCPANVANQIIKGTTHCSLDSNTPYVYVAGPMRGYEHFNFPAFDAARDALLKQGFNVISPADIDRASGSSMDELKTQSETDQSIFVFRDFYALYFLAKHNPTGKNGIVLLDNWFKSTGATAEFSLGKWLGLRFYEPDGSYYFLSTGGTCPKDFTMNNRMV